jgi:branched-chain amino acid transport system substrate-binding protein
MNRRGLRAVLITLVCLGVLSPGWAVAQDSIKIGVDQPLTGPVAASGTYIVDGAKIAANQINAEGGVLGKHIKLLIEDNRSNPTVAVEAAQKLITEDEAPVLMGAWSSTYTLAIMPLLMRYHVPMLVETSSSDKITRSNNPWIFRIAPDSQMQADAFGKYLPKFHIKKAAFLVVNNDWGLGNYKTFADLLEKNHIKVVAKELMSASDQDMSAQLSKIKASGADSLFVVTEVEQLALILKQARSLQLPQKIISASASSSPDQIIEEAGADASNGVYSIVCFTPWFAKNWPNPKLAQDFIAEWKKRGYVFAGITEGFRGYDGIRVIAAAIKQAGKAEPRAIQRAFWQVRVPGVNTTYKFAKVGMGADASGQSNANVYLIEMKGGKVIEPTF